MSVTYYHKLEGELALDARDLITELAYPPMHAKDKEPFHVPEGYYEELTAKAAALMERIVIKEEIG